MWRQHDTLRRAQQATQGHHRRCNPLMIDLSVINEVNENSANKDRLHEIGDTRYWLVDSECPLFYRETKGFREVLRAVPLGSREDPMKLRI